MATEDAGNKPLSKLDSRERTAKLAEMYPEAKVEIAGIRRKMVPAVRFCHDRGMDEAVTWAVLVDAVAEAMRLDLDAPNGLGLAMLIASYQLGDA